MFRESNRPFANRRDAGVELATKLSRYAGRNDVVVLALPRGGVPVAFEVAEALDAEFDISLYESSACPDIGNMPWERSRPAGSEYSAKTSFVRMAFPAM